VTRDLVGIQSRHDLSIAQVEALEERLYAFNAGRSGHDDAAPLAFVAEADGKLIGAAAGFTWGGVCELRQVWVDDAHRGAGLGRALVRKAIAEAGERGCSAVFLTTYDFQAPAFYAKLGFETVAAIVGKPRGHTEFAMRLQLDPSAAARPRSGMDVQENARSGDSERPNRSTASSLEAIQTQPCGSHPCPGALS